MSIPSIAAFAMLEALNQIGRTAHQGAAVESSLPLIERGHDKCITRPVDRQGADLERVARDLLIVKTRPHGRTEAQALLVLRRLSERR